MLKSYRILNILLSIISNFLVNKKEKFNYLY